MNRFMIFGGECYYASGGAYDLIETCADEEEALEKAKAWIGKALYHGNPSQEDIDNDYAYSTPIEWIQVYDCKEHKVIWKNRNAHGAGEMFSSIERVSE